MFQGDKKATLGRPASHGGEAKVKARPGNQQDDRYSSERSGSPVADQRSSRPLVNQPRSATPQSDNKSGARISPEQPLDSAGSAQEKQKMSLSEIKAANKQRAKDYEDELNRKFNGVFRPHKKEVDKASRRKSKDDPELVLLSKMSLFVLSDQNWLRKAVVWLITWDYFDYLITFCILLNSALLASTDYGTRLEADYQSSWTPIQEQIDFVFSMIFVVEAFLKIVGMGFVLHPRAYLRDYWNWLDFFIVIVSLVGLVPGINSDSLKSLRTFRILRPLRSINSMPRMRNLIQSLLASIPGLLNTIAFLAFIFAIFAIFGTNQFLGKQYQFCRSTEEVVFPEDGSPAFWPKLEDDGSPALCATDAQCAAAFPDAEVAVCGAIFAKAGLNPIEFDDVRNIDLIMYNIPGFDNFVQSILTIFQILTLESWSYLVYNYSDTGDAEISAIFFTLVVVFGAFFTMNLVLAQIMDSFAQEEDKRLQKEREEKEEEEREKAYEAERKREAEQEARDAELQAKYEGDANSGAIRVAESNVAEGQEDGLKMSEPQLIQPMTA